MFEHVRHRPPSETRRPRELTIVLSPIRSSVNLSRIVRLAGCAGISTIYQIGPGKVDRSIARDAADIVEVIHRRTLVPVLNDLREAGYRLAGLEQTTGSQCLFDYSFVEKTALIVGSEREGLDDAALAALDDAIEIPVYGQPASYNVATATIMAVYEYMRQFR